MGKKWGAYETAKHIANPLEDYNGKIHFKKISVFNDFKNSVQTQLLNPGSFEGTLLAIHFDYDGVHTVEGSGAMVAPGLMICAGHVIKPHYKAMKESRVKAFATAICGRQIQQWQMIFNSEVPNSDLIIMQLEYTSKMPQDATFKQLIISLRVPEIGEQVSIAGFHAVEKSYDKENDAYYTAGAIIVSPGIVTQRFETGRDRVICPGPTIEVTSSTRGGMSGGPVFDKNGHLIGLLTSSYDDGPSYASLIWPALTTPFPAGWPTQCYTNSPNILATLEEDLCSIKHRENLSLVTNDENVLIGSIFHG